VADPETGRKKRVALPTTGDNDNGSNDNKGSQAGGRGDGKASSRRGATSSSSTSSSSSSDAADAEQGGIVVIGNGDVDAVVLSNGTRVTPYALDDGR
jgi:hypothetical protein